MPLVAQELTSILLCCLQIFVYSLADTLTHMASNEVVGKCQNCVTNNHNHFKNTP